MGLDRICHSGCLEDSYNGVVVKIIMVPSWIPMIIRHLIFRVPKK